jgi:prepilin-type N-terminal cleavage/methylation domain-containing protein
MKSHQASKSRAFTRPSTQPTLITKTSVSNSLGLKGFTLIEVIIVLAILAMALTCVISFGSRNVTFENVNAETKIALAQLMQERSQALNGLESREVFEVTFEKLTGNVLGQKEIIFPQASSTESSIKESLIINHEGAIDWK